MDQLTDSGLRDPVILVLLLALIGGVALTFGLKRWLGRVQFKYDYVSHWSRIKSYSADGKTRPLALLEADKLLDLALKEAGYRGQTMAQRLKEAEAGLSQPDRVWYYHRLRNRIVHEAGVEVKAQQLKKALAVFSRAIYDLGGPRLT